MKKNAICVPNGLTFPMLKVNCPSLISIFLESSSSSSISRFSLNQVIWVSGLMFPICTGQWQGQHVWACVSDWNTDILTPKSKMLLTVAVNSTLHSGVTLNPRYSTKWGPVCENSIGWWLLNTFFFTSYSKISLLSYVVEYQLNG